MGSLSHSHQTHSRLCTLANLVVLINPATTSFMFLSKVEDMGSSIVELELNEMSQIPLLIGRNLKLGQQLSKSLLDIPMKNE